MTAKDNVSFRNIRVESTDSVANCYGIPLEYRCCWCEGPAFFTVSRTSVLTGREFTDYACTPCAQKWVTPSLQQRSAFLKNMWKTFPPGRRDQFRERVSESRSAVAAKLTLEQRREMTRVAREKRQALRDSCRASSHGAPSL